MSPLEQDTKEFDPNEPSDASVQSRGLTRQPDSTTMEDLEDAGDPENRGDADDDDMKALGAHCEETIGVDGETLDECESGEEAYVDDVNGGFLDLEMAREARVEELAGYLKMQVYCRVPVAEIGSLKVIKTRWVDTNKRGRAVSRNLLPAGGERGEETKQHKGGEHELLRIHSTS